VEPALPAPPFASCGGWAGRRGALQGLTLCSAVPSGAEEATRTGDVRRVHDGKRVEAASLPGPLRSPFGAGGVGPAVMRGHPTGWYPGEAQNAMRASAPPRPQPPGSSTDVLVEESPEDGKFALSTPTCRTLCPTRWGCGARQWRRAEPQSPAPPRVFFGAQRTRPRSCCRGGGIAG
jgi:hypothetical protein